MSAPSGWTGAILLALASAASAQRQGAAIDAWRAEHGANWRVALDDGTGRVEFLFGGLAPARTTPRNDELWFARAREVLAQAQALHGIEAATLVEDRALPLPLGMVGSSDKFTVRFRQAVRGVPVEAGSVNVLFDATGALLSIQTHALPDVAQLDLAASLSAESAADAAAAEFARTDGLRGALVAAPELVIAQVVEAERRTPRLAWKVELLAFDASAQPVGWRYFVDAKGDATVLRERTTHALDVGGTLVTYATPGLAPDTAANPATPHPMRYARVQSAAGVVFTDANGRFNFPGVTGPLACTFRYVGTFNDVSNYFGADHSVTQSLTGLNNAVVLNPTPTEFVTSQANAFVHANRMRDWIRAVNPFDTHADFVHTAECNAGTMCNAYFLGSSVSFQRDNGTCPNTCYSTIFAHEDGHWLNEIYGTGNEYPTGMGEGNADMFAMYLNDTNVVGKDFYGPGVDLRDGTNTLQYCGDCCAGCWGGGHGEGKVWMGAGWKVRRNLKLNLGPGAGSATADALFLGWMNAFDQATVNSVIEAQWMTLDDNDGNLNNGTPHFQSIDDGFRAQGFPGLQFDRIAISNVTRLADTHDEVGPYVVAAHVASNVGATITGVELLYRVGWNGPFQSVAMTQTPAGWRGALPGQSSPAKVFYFVRATDGLANQLRFPSSGAADPFFFGVGNVQVVACDAFEAASGWSPSQGNPSSGVFQRGDPLGTFQGGVAAQPEFDASPAGTECWFTGQGTAANLPDEADVDGGPFWLTSPPFSFVYESAQVDYSYWFYNDDGDDELIVELSDDGSNWVDARKYKGGAGGWATDRIDVRHVLGLVAQFQIRFRVADSPNNSITEVALDDVCISTLAPNGCSVPLVFCTAKIDSSFCAPHIAAQGFAVIGGVAAMDISLSNASAGRNGLLFYGYGAQALPYLGGTMCATGPLRRTTVQSTGGSSGCSGTMSFDFNHWLRSGVDPNLVAGQTVVAQYYYRDPFDTFAVALSDALRFSICP